MGESLEYTLPIPGLCYECCFKSVLNMTLLDLFFSAKVNFCKKILWGQDDNDTFYETS